MTNTMHKPDGDEAKIPLIIPPIRAENFNPAILSEGRDQGDAKDRAKVSSQRRKPEQSMQERIEDMAQSVRSPVSRELPPLSEEVPSKPPRRVFGKTPLPFEVVEVNPADLPTSSRSRKEMKAKQQLSLNQSRGLATPVKSHLTAPAEVSPPSSDASKELSPEAYIKGRVNEFFPGLMKAFKESILKANLSKFNHLNDEEYADWCLNEMVISGGASVQPLYALMAERKHGALKYNFQAYIKSLLVPVIRELRAKLPKEDKTSPQSRISVPVSRMAPRTILGSARWAVLAALGIGAATLISGTRSDRPSVDENTSAPAVTAMENGGKVEAPNTQPASLDNSAKTELPAAKATAPETKSNRYAFTLNLNNGDQTKEYKDFLHAIRQATRLRDQLDELAHAEIPSELSEKLGPNPTHQQVFEAFLKMGSDKKQSSFVRNFVKPMQAIHNGAKTKVANMNNEEAMKDLFAKEPGVYSTYRLLWNAINEVKVIPTSPGGYIINTEGNLAKKFLASMKTAPALASIVNLALQEIKTHPIDNPENLPRHFFAVAEALALAKRGKEIPKGVSISEETLKALGFHDKENGALGLIRTFKNQDGNNPNTEIGRMIRDTRPAPSPTTTQTSPASRPTEGDSTIPTNVVPAPTPVQKQGSSPLPSGTTGSLHIPGLDTQFRKDSPTAAPTRLSFFTNLTQKFGSLNLGEKFANLFKSTPKVQSHYVHPSTKVAFEVAAEIEKERDDAANLWKQATAWRSDRSFVNNLGAKLGKITYGLFGYKSKTVEDRMNALAQNGSLDFKERVDHATRKPITVKDLNKELAAIRAANLEDLRPGAKPADKEKEFTDEDIPKNSFGLGKLWNKVSTKVASFFKKPAANDNASEQSEEKVA